MKSIFLLCLITVLLYSCSSSSVQNNKVAADTTKTSQQTANGKMAPELERLLTHFKENNTFPVVIDSAYIANVNKGDSLGGSQVKLIAKHWHKDDSLQLNPEYALKDFYTIDSVKAKGTFKKWAEKLDIGMTKFANAYALQKVKLDENTTILIWALVSVSYEADPVFNNADVYYTIVSRDTIKESFLLGNLNQSADPPSEAESMIISKLNKDGAILMNEHILTEDSDSLIAEITHNRYEYTLSDGRIKLKGKKLVSYSPRVKVKE